MEEKPADVVEVASEATAVSVPTSNWWSPWLDVAKSKSTEVFEFVKKDLTEISTVVKSEASAVVNSTASALKDSLSLDETEKSLKRSVSSFLDSVSSVFNPPFDDEGEEALLVQNDNPVPLSRFQTRLYSLIKNPETFTKPIDPDMMSQFESWLNVGEEQLATEKLTKLLVASPDLHNLYELLVPSQVSHLEFWQRYLFRKAVLEDEESLLEAKEKKEQAQMEQVHWEKENFAQGIDLTEEEQIKILADYEEEQKNKSPEKKMGKGSKQLIEKEKQGMVVVEEDQQQSRPDSTSSGESKDTDDWEKDFDLGDSETNDK